MPNTLSHRFKYDERKVVIPDHVDLLSAAVDKGIKRTVLPSRLRLPNGARIIYDIVVINEMKRFRMKHVVLTALSENNLQPIGFRDLRISDAGICSDVGCFGHRGERIPEEKASLWKFHDDGIPYIDFRFGQGNEQGANGFLMAQNAINTGIEHGIFFTVYEIARKIGAKKHWIVDKATNLENSYFSQFVEPDTATGHFYFDLS